MSKTVFTQAIAEGIPATLPPMPPLAEAVDRAPARRQVLSSAEKRLALRNALRYFPVEQHAKLAPEFLAELETDGRIYMRRFRPTEYEMRAHPIESYPAKCKAAAAISDAIWVWRIHDWAAREVFSLIGRGQRRATSCTRSKTTSLALRRAARP